MKTIMRAFILTLMIWVVFNQNDCCVPQYSVVPDPNKCALDGRYIDACSGSYVASNYSADCQGSDSCTVCLATVYSC